MPDADDSLVRVSREGRIGVVLLNRPKQLNALSSELMTALAAALEELDADADIRAIVLGGSERAFAAGADIGELAAKGREGRAICGYEDDRVGQAVCDCPGSSTTTFDEVACSTSDLNACASVSIGGKVL